MAGIANPGDRCPGFTAEAKSCWAMVYSSQMQATHCRQECLYTGRWHSPRNNGDWWRVWSCPDHLDGLTGVREFGRRS